MADSPNKNGPDALGIVADYVGHAAPNVRRNAAIALGAIGSPEAVDLLAGLSDDKDVNVRHIAERELVRLPDEQVDELRARLLKDLHAESKNTQDAAYRLLGLIGGGTREAQAGSPDLWARFAIARRANLSPDARLTAAKQLVESAGRIALGMVIGILGAVGLVALLRPDFYGDDVGPHLAYSCVLAALIGVPITILGLWKASPVTLHYDRWIGTAVEIAKTVAWIAVATIPFVLVALTLATPAAAGAAALSFIIAVAALRYAVLLPSGALGGRPGEVALRAIVGATAFVVVYVLLAALTRAVAGSSITAVPAVTWLPLLAAAGGLAAAFGLIEARSPKQAPLGTHGVVLTTVIFLAFFSWVALERRARVATLDGRPSTSSLTVLPTRIPFEARLSIPTAVTAWVSLNGPAATDTLGEAASDGVADSIVTRNLGLAARGCLSERGRETTSACAGFVERNQEPLQTSVEAGDYALTVGFDLHAEESLGSTIRGIFEEIDTYFRGRRPDSLSIYLEPGQAREVGQRLASGDTLRVRQEGNDGTLVMPSVPASLYLEIADGAVTVEAAWEEIRDFEGHIEEPDGGYLYYFDNAQRDFPVELQPGLYELHFRGPQPETLEEPVYLDLEIEAKSSAEPERLFDQRFRSLPVQGAFTLDAARSVSIVATQDWQDNVLEISHEGQRLRIGDDPPAVQGLLLPPGTYQWRVYPYNGIAGTLRGEERIYATGNALQRSALEDGATAPAGESTIGFIELGPESPGLLFDVAFPQVVEFSQTAVPTGFRLLRVEEDSGGVILIDRSSAEGERRALDVGSYRVTQSAAEEEGYLEIGLNVARDADVDLPRLPIDLRAEEGSELAGYRWIEVGGEGGEGDAVEVPFTVDFPQRVEIRSIGGVRWTLSAGEDERIAYGLTLDPVLPPGEYRLTPDAASLPHALVLRLNTRMAARIIER